MKFDFFEDLLQNPSLFKDESKLDFNYIPESLPHRQNELSLLSQLFLSLLNKPFSISRRVLISGKTGIGKTVTIKFFCRLLREAAKNREVYIKSVHINCRKERTSYKVLIKILRKLDKDFPKRGYSPQDLLDNISEYIKIQNMHLVIVLDELSYMIDNDEDFIYSLTRINDDRFNSSQRISIIGIVRDICFINNLDSSSLSTLQRNIIKFRKYNVGQTTEILKYRRDLSLKSNVFSDDLIKLVSEITHGEGDIRRGLDIIWKASLIAERKGLEKVNVECIHLSCQDSLPYVTKDFIQEMSPQKLVFLLAIVKTLEKLKDFKTSLNQVRVQYKVLCETLGIKPRSNSQIWNYLQEFKKENIISLKVLSRDIKGRRSSIEIHNIPLKILNDIIIELLEIRGMGI